MSRVQRPKFAETLEVSTGPDDSTANSNAQSEGYIRVGVRVRPLASDRGAADKLLIADAAQGRIDDGKGHTFDFSAVFEQEDNEAIFEVVGRPLVENVITG